LKQQYDISPEEFDLIERYLGKTLTREESTAFEKRLLDDPVWKEKVNEVNLLMLGIRETVLEKKLEGFHHALAGESLIKKTKPVISMARVWLVAASCVAVLGLGYWWYMGSESKYDKMYAAYYQPDPGLPTTMSVANNYQFDKGMVAYKAGDYREATELWQRLSASMPGNDSLYYFLGVAELALDNRNKALNYLKPLAADSQKPYSKEACWYTGLLLLKEGKTEQAADFIRKSQHPESKKLLLELNQ
jgi:hypothetical protein